MAKINLEELLVGKKMEPRYMEWYAPRQEDNKK